MPSRVFFADLRADTRENLTDKINRLLDEVEISSRIKDKELVALKLHFGEKGNTAFIRPVFLRDIVQKVKSCGGKPFLTDSNTLYRGERGEAVSHLTLALEHGFSFATVAAPVIIADGLRGNASKKVKVTGKHFSTVAIASAI